jgi:hypothetical protein
MMLLLGAAGSAMAGAVAAVPEIDPVAAVSAFVLLSGGLLVIRGRRKR